MRCASSPAPTASRAPAQRGISLIEALIAVCVLGLSLLIGTQWQLQLQLHSELAQERSAAVEWAVNEHERLRAQALSPSDTPTQTSTPTAPESAASEDTLDAPSTPPYGGQLSQTHQPAAGHDTVQSQLRWPHRGQAEQQVRLITVIGPSTTTASASLELPPQDHSLAGRRRPAVATTTPHGSAPPTLTSPDAAHLVWQLDPLTGDIVQRCERSPADAPSPTDTPLRCEPFRARLWHGHVRFDLGPTPDALNAHDPPLPLSVEADGQPCITQTITQTITPTITQTPAQTTTPAPERHIAFACPGLPTLTGLNTSSLPTFRFTPRGWQLGEGVSLGPGVYRLCRYPGQADAPQNFLVVRADLTCPAPLTPHNQAPIAPAPATS